ncbi:MAG: hypothetical protein WC224_03610 [Sphaerochaetaceae bacterium]
MITSPIVEAVIIVKETMSRMLTRLLMLKNFGTKREKIKHNTIHATNEGLFSMNILNWGGMLFQIALCRQFLVTFNS